MHHQYLPYTVRAIVYWCSRIGSVTPTMCFVAAATGFGAALCMCHSPQAQVSELLQPRCASGGFCPESCSTTLSHHKGSLCWLQAPIHSIELCITRNQATAGSSFSKPFSIRLVSGCPQCLSDLQFHGASIYDIWRREVIRTPHLHSF